MYSFRKRKRLATGWKSLIRHQHGTKKSPKLKLLSPQSSTTFTSPPHTHAWTPSHSQCAYNWCESAFWHTLFYLELLKTRTHGSHSVCMLLTALILAAVASALLLPYLIHNASEPTTYYAFTHNINYYFLLSGLLFVLCGDFGSLNFSSVTDK
jgi:hypothetical protein